MNSSDEEGGRAGGTAGGRGVFGVGRRVGRFIGLDFYLATTFIISFLFVFNVLLL